MPPVSCVLYAETCERKADALDRRADEMTANSRDAA
jgi:hypothetical protein